MRALAAYPGSTAPCLQLVAASGLPGNSTHDKMLRQPCGTPHNLPTIRTGKVAWTTDTCGGSRELDISSTAQVVAGRSLPPGTPRADSSDNLLSPGAPTKICRPLPPKTTSSSAKRIYLFHHRSVDETPAEATANVVRELQDSLGAAHPAARRSGSRRMLRAYHSVDEQSNAASEILVRPARATVMDSTRTLLKYESPRGLEHRRIAALTTASDQPLSAG